MKIIISMMLLALSLSVFAEYVPRPKADASELEKTVFRLKQDFFFHMHGTNKHLANYKKNPKSDVGELAFSVNGELNALEKLAEYSEDQMPKVYADTIKKRTPFLESVLADYSDYFEKHSERYERFR